MSYERVRAAAAVIADRTGRSEHRVAAVLGSGLGDYARSLPEAIELPHREIPGLPTPKVEGHSASLFSVEMGGIPMLIFAGRVHTYEGWDMDHVVFGVRVAGLAGCRTVVLTNAAGGIGDGLAPGDFVLIRDHLNLAGQNPLVGENDERLGTRFPDMTDIYSERLRTVARSVAADLGIELQEGVYAWMLGPSYETPAEIQMLKRLGADLVGMSSVPEAIAARHMGNDVLAISLVTNLAAGISPVPLSHEEVQETADQARDRFAGLLDALLPKLANS